MSLRGRLLTPGSPGLTIGKDDLQSRSDGPLSKQTETEQYGSGNAEAQGFLGILPLQKADLAHVKASETEILSILHAPSIA
jgi:hypothetical protein